jgi:hypothetical protein
MKSCSKLSYGATEVHLRSFDRQDPPNGAEIYFTGSGGPDSIGPTYPDTARTLALQDAALATAGITRQTMPDKLDVRFQHDLNGKLYSVHLTDEPPMRQFHLRLEITPA